MLHRYQQLAEDLIRMIRRGEIAPGQALPTEKELAQHFQMSRYTVREALKLIKQTGQVVSRQGSAWRVADQEDSRVQGERVLSFSTYIWRNASTSGLLAGLSQVLAVHGHRVVPRKFLTVYSARGVAELRHRGAPDGLAFFANHHIDAKRVRELSAWDIPVVALGIEGQVPIDTVSCDYRAGARELVARLLHAGCRELCYLGSRTLNDIVPTICARLHGYREALRAHGLPERMLLYPGSNLAEAWNADLERALCQGRHRKPVGILLDVPEQLPALTARLATQRHPDRFRITTFLSANMAMPSDERLIAVAVEDWQAIGAIAAGRILAQWLGAAGPPSWSLCAPRIQEPMAERSS